MDFFAKVARECARLGLTREELASRAKFGRTQLSKWQRNYEEGKPRGGPSIWQGAAIARVLGVPVEYLVNETIDEPQDLLPTEDERVLIELYRAVQPDPRAALRAIAKLANAALAEPTAAVVPHRDPNSTVTSVPSGPPPRPGRRGNTA